MAYRSFMEGRSALIVQSLNNLGGVASTTTSYPKTGRFQYIANPVTTGSFIPGQWRVNANTILKVTSRVTDSEIYVPPFYPTMGGARITGPIAAENFAVNTSGGVSTFPGRSDPTTWDTRLGNLVHVKAYAKKNNPSNFDAGTFLGELSESLRMLRSPFKELTKFVSSRRRWRDPRSLVNAASNTYLEFRYGINPLASDIASIAALIDRHASAMENQIFIERSHCGTAKASVGAGQSSGFGNVMIDWKYRYNTDIAYTSGVGFRRSTGMSDTLSNYGLSVTDVPSLIWELTPYSFVVDWFWNVGPWIRAMSPNLSTTLLGSYISQKSTETIVKSSTGVRTGGSLGVRSFPAVASHLDVTIEKLVRIAGPALPALPVRSIGVRDFTRAVDGLSLMWQKLPRGWRHP